MEAEIANFMLRAAKLEFFLVNLNREFAHTKTIGSLTAVAGVNWTQVASYIENSFPFFKFNFDQSAFTLLRLTAPQLLTISEGQALKWDSDEGPIDSWDRLLSRSYAQLRNNIAHGNKFQLASPFTQDRTLHFITAAHALIDFITRDVFRSPHWETPLVFS